MPPRREISGALALLALLVGVALVYGRSLGIGLLSDAYYILDHVRHGFAHALRWDHSYHYVPVTNEFLALLWKLFGLWDPGYQLTSLLQLVVNGGLLFVLGRRWLADSRLALFAALLFVVNSAFYEVTCWAINGNLHNLSATWTLLAILALDRAVCERKLATGGWLFAGLVLVAFLTYELTISLTVIGALIAWLRLAEADGARPFTWLWRPAAWRRLLVLLTPTVLVGAVAVASKLYFQSVGMQVTNTAGSYGFNLYLLVRGVIATFTLTGPDNLLFRQMTLGLPVAWGTPAMHAIVVAWAIGLAAAVVGLIWRARSSTLRLLVLWVTVHLGLAHLFTGLVSRHFFLAALPASMLLVLWARGVARWLATVLPRRRAHGLVGAVVILVTALSISHVQRAITLHLDATAASRSLIDVLGAALAERPEAQRVLLLDMPAILARGGMGSYVFINGLHQQVAFAFGDRVSDLDLRYTPAALPRNELANASHPIGGKDLRARLGDPSWVVLRLDPETWRVRGVAPAELPELLRKR